MVEDIDGQVSYSSSSPDEIALTNFARLCDIEYRGLSHDNMIMINDVAETKLVYQFEFTSLRKRQSVIVMDKDGSYTLYTKGADNVILERTRPAQLQT